MSSAPSTPSKTTQTTEPPAFIQPFLQDAAQQARGIYMSGGPQQYGGNTVVPFSQQTEDAMRLTQQRAMNGSPVNAAAQNYTTRTLNSPVQSQFGTGTNPYATSVYQNGSNPYLDAKFNQAADQIQNRLQSGFAGSGRNIEAGRPVAKEEFSELATGIYGGAYESDAARRQQAALTAQGIGAQGYESERDRMYNDMQSQYARQAQAAGMAPGLAATDYQDIAALGGVGTQVEDLAGRYMEDQARRFDFEQNRAGQNLDNYIARITGSYPGQQGTMTTPTYRNRGAGAAGGALAGAQLGAQVGGPWGALIGGLGGGILGYQ